MLRDRGPTWLIGGSVQKSHEADELYSLRDENAAKKGKFLRAHTVTLRGVNFLQNPCSKQCHHSEPLGRCGLHSPNDGQRGYRNPEICDHVEYDGDVGKNTITARSWCIQPVSRRITATLEGCGEHGECDIDPCDSQQAVSQSFMYDANDLMNDSSCRAFGARNCRR